MCWSSLSSSNARKHIPTVHQCPAPRGSLHSHFKVLTWAVGMILSRRQHSDICSSKSMANVIPWKFCIWYIQMSASPVQNTYVHLHPHCTAIFQEFILKLDSWEITYYPPLVQEVPWHPVECKNSWYTCLTIEYNSIKTFPRVLEFPWKKNDIDTNFSSSLTNIAVSSLCSQ